MSPDEDKRMSPHYADALRPEGSVIAAIPDGLRPSQGIALGQDAGFAAANSAGIKQASPARLPRFGLAGQGLAAAARSAASLCSR